MENDAGFVAALLANPSDETLRMVYADCLEERGDPRAEWIRIQVQLQQLAAEGRWDSALGGRRRQIEPEIDPRWLTAARFPRRDGLGIRNWHEFYDSLVIEPVYGEAFPKPTIAQLDQFEAEAGFRLPRSYRDYIVVFGPGKLLTDWDIAAPCSDISCFWDLCGMHENMRPDERWIDGYPEEHQNRVRRCRYFCSAYKDSYGWDSTEVCDHNANEYAV